MRIVVTAGLMLVCITPLSAQVAPLPGTITIASSGRTETPPDIATLSLNMRGEGRTPDAATAALAAKQKAILAGLRRIDDRLVVHTGAVSIREVRTGNCIGNFTGGPAIGLDAVADTMDSMAGDMTLPEPGTPTKGPCKVVGSLAEISAQIELASVKDAGTAIGLAGRLGAANAQLESFGLRDPAAASRRAVASAIANARADATAIAEASGAQLGALLSVTNTDRDRSYALGITPPAIVAYDMAMPSAPPVTLDVSPKPVETSVQLTVTFAIAK